MDNFVSIFSMFRIFDGKKTQLYGWHIFKLIFYYVTPPSPPSHLGMLDYVIRKIPRLALSTNIAPPALPWSCAGVPDMEANTDGLFANSDRGKISSVAFRKKRRSGNRL